MVDCESVWDASDVCRNFFQRPVGFIGGGDARKEREVDKCERVKKREGVKMGHTHWAGRRLRWRRQVSVSVVGGCGTYFSSVGMWMRKVELF